MQLKFRWRYVHVDKLSTYLTIMHIFLLLNNKKIISIVIGYLFLSCKCLLHFLHFSSFFKKSCCWSEMVIFSLRHFTVNICSSKINITKLNIWNIKCFKWKLYSEEILATYVKTSCNTHPTYTRSLSSNVVLKYSSKLTVILKSCQFPSLWT